jgi:predicted ATPase/DNA-binding CsgD family transcriptional regulator
MLVDLRLPGPRVKWETQVSTRAIRVTTFPAPLTRFVGRQAELAEATSLLLDNRLLTLTGPGGAGKTRLAVQLATHLTGDFPDGAWFVDFGPLSSGEFLWDQVASALGVREPRTGTLAGAVGRRLAGRRALLVLDNCEHVVESAAQIAAALLASANVKVLATSRQPLGVGGEVTWPMPPLAVADGIDLFTDRARQAWPQFRLQPGDAEAVRSICRRLDGLPLAIELAAARARALAPALIAAGLKDHLALLPIGPRTAPRRQSTLGASFDWSYELLFDPERALLRQLSVFAGGFDLEAALAVCPAASLELLAALTDRSLIMVEGRIGQARPRYRMLETIRQFAGELLDEADEVELLRDRHRDYYLALAEPLESVVTSPDDARAHAVLSPEQDNLRSAMAWSRDRGESEALARFVVALGWYWGLSNRFVEMARWLEPAQRDQNLAPHLRARMKIYEGMVALFKGDPGELPSLANEALGLARSTGDQKDEALALVMLGILAGLISGSDSMRPYVEEAVRLARAARFAYGVVMALEFFVVMRMFQSDPEETSRLIDEAIGVARTGVARHTFLTVRSFRGIFSITQGRLAEARQILTAVVEDGRHMTDFNYLHSVVDLGLVELFMGDLAAARSHVAEGVAGAEKSEAMDRSAVGVGTHSRLVLGWIELAAGDPVKAKELMTAAADGARASMLRAVAALPLVMLGEAQLRLGSLDDAAAAFEEASTFAESRKQTWLMGRVRLAHARLRAQQGDLEEAESLAHDALRMGDEAGDRMGLVDGLELLATLAGEHESHLEATRLWAASDFERQQLRYSRFPVQQPLCDSALARSRQALGSEDFATSWAEGARLSLEQAIAYAARGRGERKRPVTGWASLTPSEVEVARLVGEHLSNPEIARRLFVSRATVKTHLVHIFAKLSIDSRSALAEEVIKRRRQPEPSGRA